MPWRQRDALSWTYVIAHTAMFPKEAEMHTKTSILTIMPNRRFPASKKPAFDF